MFRALQFWKYGAMCSVDCIIVKGHGEEVTWCQVIGKADRSLNP